MFWREVFEVKFLSRADPEAGQLRADFLLFRAGGSELQREAEVVKEAGLDHFLVNLGEVDGRSRLGRGLAQIVRERLHLVAGLDLDHVLPKYLHILLAKQVRIVLSYWEATEDLKFTPHNIFGCRI